MSYYTDFVIYPILTVIFTVLFVTSFSTLALYTAGVTLFTFAEYWVHRTWLHRVMWHSTHQRHHVHPEEYIVFPWYYIPGIMLGFFCILPFASFAGFLLGYCWFIYWHHILHHWDLSKMPAWIQRYSAWHEMHHYKTRYNYGITHPLWDVVFGTYKKL